MLVPPPVQQEIAQQTPALIAYAPVPPGPGLALQHLGDDGPDPRHLLQEPRPARRSTSSSAASRATAAWRAAKSFQMAGVKTYWSSKSAQQAWRCVNGVKITAATSLPPNRFADVGLARARRVRQPPAALAAAATSRSNAIPAKISETAGDLHRVQRLRQQDEREERRRRTAGGSRRATHATADAVDRREPEDVREEERPDHRVAEAEPDLPAERENCCSPSCGMLTSASGTQPIASTSALIRYGEYRRMSGAIVTV